MNIKQFENLDPHSDLNWISNESVKPIRIIGSYDGPMCGIVGYHGDKYYAYSHGEHHLRRFLMVKLTDEQCQALCDAADKRQHYEIMYKLEKEGIIYGAFTDLDYVKPEKEPEKIFTGKEFRDLDPFNKIPYVQREEITPLYYVGRMDGTMTGVVSYKGAKYYACCPDRDLYPRKFLMVSIPEDQEQILADAAKNYASDPSKYSPIMSSITEPLKSTADIMGYFEHWEY